MLKINKKSLLFSKAARLSILAVATAFAVALPIVPHMVRADKFDEQVKQLQQDSASKLDAVAQLKNQATSFQDAINRLQIQIDALQIQINASQAQQAALQAQIDESQRQIDQQKGILGDNIHAMYVEGQITTIEMLATSKDLSQFVDKEEYRTTIKNKIQDTLKRIAELQNEMKAQKTQVDALLAIQQAQQGQLDASRAEQARMLSYNAAQQAGFNSQIKSNQAKVADLRKQQSIENAKLFSGSGSHIIAGNNGNDTYPNKWRNASQDSMVDTWGMYNRECVSYTAWKVYESGRSMPYWGGVGNANQWDDNARNAGIPVDGSPRAGDVAIKNSQPYGHAMYVEHVYSDGSIYISQYNQSLDGTYSEAIISAEGVRSANLQFVHFR